MAPPLSTHHRHSSVARKFRRQHPRFADIAYADDNTINKLREANQTSGGSTIGR